MAFNTTHEGEHALCTRDNRNSSCCGGILFHRSCGYSWALCLCIAACTGAACVVEQSTRVGCVQRVCTCLREWLHRQDWLLKCDVSLISQRPNV
jgi:hypothetical protein